MRNAGGGAAQRVVFLFLCLFDAYDKSEPLKLNKETEISSNPP